MMKAVLLALLAFTGPLQAQLIYACSADEGMEAMEDMVGSCCHDQDGNLVSPDCNTDAATRTSPCMEMGISDDIDQSARNQSPIERDHSRDPPPATGPPPADLLPAPVRQHAQRTAPATVPRSRGTDTYLLTRRLRL